MKLKSTTLLACSFGILFLFLASCEDQVTKIDSEEFKNAEVVKLDSELLVVEAIQAELDEFYTLKGSGNLSDSMNMMTESGEAFAYVAKVKLPKCKRVIKRPGSAVVNIQGLDFFLKDSKVVGVGSLSVTPKTLDAITETFAMLDDYLFNNCEDLNREYSRPNPSDVIIQKLIDQKERIVSKFIDAVVLIKTNALMPDSEKKIVDGMATIKADTATTN